jgi:hypothetical protein
VGLKLNGTHQLLAYADDMNLLGDTIDTMKKNAVSLIDTSKRKPSMLLSRHQNAGQNRNVKITNRSFENVLQLKYLGRTVTNQNLIRRKLRRD